MATDISDGAVFQEHNAVGSANGRQAVGDHDHQASPCRLPERPDQRVLGLGVKGRGGLVEYQYARVAHETPGNAEPLLLSYGERIAGLSELGVEAVGQTLDKLHSTCGPAGSLYISITGAGIGQ